MARETKTILFANSVTENVSRLVCNKTKHLRNNKNVIKTVLSDLIGNNIRNII